MSQSTLFKTIYSIVVIDTVYIDDVLKLKYFKIFRSPMNYSRKSVISGGVLIVGLFIILSFYQQKINTDEVPVEIESYISQSSKINERSNKPRYHVKEFSIIMTGKKFSNKQINDHKELYKKYVDKRNEVYEKLQKIDKKSANNVSYSAFRGLKLAETFVRNASLLHELYFENIGGQTSIGELTLEIIMDNFDSFEAFKEDLLATASSARGWAIMSYNIDDQRVHNYLLDAHNEKVPVLIIPLLVIDTYEHAYMIDFGINRKEYLDILWDNINWDVVEKRVKLCYLIQDNI